MKPIKYNQEYYRDKRTEYVNPRSAGVIPHSAPNYDTIWFEFQPHKVLSQRTLARGNTTQIDRHFKLPSFKFIAPAEILETSSHKWEQFDSLLSRLGGVLGSAMRAGNEGEAVIKAGTAAVKKIGEVIADSRPVGEALTQVGMAALGGLKSSKIYNFRIDQPLIYVGSERRSIELTFLLVEEGGGASDIIEPVKLIQEMSCAVQGQDLISIDIPYVWTIKTYPISWINFEFAALKTVQPTYKGPYIGGYPASCDLHLSFESLDPLYRSVYTGDLQQLVTQNNNKNQNNNSTPRVRG